MPDRVRDLEDVAEAIGEQMSDATRKTTWLFLMR